MFAWLVYYCRVFAAVIIGGAAAIMGIMSSTDDKSRAALLSVAGVLGVAAFLAWPRRPNAWRDDRPTDRQLQYAKDLGLRVCRGATKGEVSDMISEVTGR